jgi:hypothetical protein
VEQRDKEEAVALEKVEQLRDVLEQLEQPADDTGDYA